MKSPGLAAVLSLVVPGVGQIYNGHLVKGLLLVFLALPIAWLSLGILIGFVLVPVLYIWATIDAYRTAERINADG